MDKKTFLQALNNTINAAYFAGIENRGDVFTYPIHRLYSSLLNKTLDKNEIHFAESVKFLVAAAKIHGLNNDSDVLAYDIRTLYDILIRNQ